ncbi:MAG: preprotein translocase subunit SecE [Actinomycetia bacterium]|nr:preprotein translocase subunit SecE [Actinomycetes bacterium]
MAQKAKAAKPSIFARISKSLNGVRIEMKRVVWPSRSEVISSSVVVILTLLFFIAFTFIVDNISSWLFIDLLGKIGR